MKKFKPRIVVVPHYIGTQNKTKIFKKIFMEQVEKKLKEKELAEQNNNSHDNTGNNKKV